MCGKDREDRARRVVWGVGFAPAALILLAVGAAGCGGTRRAADTDAPSATAEAAAEAEEAEPGAEEPSGIPGLTMADVEAMPEAPPLPGGFDHTTTRERVEQEAAAMAEREQRRRDAPEVDVEKRRAYIAHVWWQEVRTEQRAQPSDIPGLSVGQVEDMPAAPPLPELFDLRHDRQDLAEHAVVVALEEADADELINEVGIDARVTYLTWAWTPLLAQRQAEYRAAIAEREALADRRLAEARREAEWKGKIRQQRAEIEHQIWLESMKTNPVLTERERAELEALGAD